MITKYQEIKKNEKASCRQGNDSFQPGNIFIGDSAATSHMTSNEMGVHNLTPMKGSVTEIYPR